MRKQHGNASASRFLLLIVAASLPGVIVSLCVNRNVRARRVANLGLVISERNLDLGEVWLSDSLRRTFEIANPNENDIRIVGFRSSCACTSVVPESLVVPARGSASIAVTLDVTTDDLDKATARSFPFAVRLVPLFADARESHPGWFIRGVVRNAFHVTPRALTFGGAEVLFADAPAAGKTLTVTSNYPDVSVFADVAQDLGRVQVIPLDAQMSPKAWEVKVYPTITMTPGPFQFAVRICAKDSQGHDIGDIMIPVRGVVSSDISALPSTIRFGPSHVGLEEVRSLVLQSRSRVPFIVEDYQAEVPYLHVARLTDGAADHHTFVITADLPEAGYDSSVLQFRIRGNALPVTVPVSCLSLE